MHTTHRIVHGDSRTMSLLPDASIHLVITSPPYWQLKDYGTDDQIGFHENYENYVNNLNLVWSECHRVLKPGCRLCINIGDQFARSVYYGRYKVIPIRTEIIKFCEIAGFDYMGAIIWQKVTTCNTTGGATIMGSFPYPRNGIVKIDYEFILLFKKHGATPAPSKEQKERSRMSKEEWNEYFAGHWCFAGAKQDGHIAMFPEELPARLIKMFSFSGETVLDPFAGSGTTSLAARNLDRNSVGYEINSEYIHAIKDKLNVYQADIEATEYRFLEDRREPELHGEIRRLPYIFKDPHALNKKVDPKKLRFGSRIDKNGADREHYYTVKEIVSPEKVTLSNNMTVRLIGLKEKVSANGQAIQYLADKTRGRKVFLKFDNRKYDDNDNLLCYLYLQNKTFINAHIVREGLVDVDISYPFKYRDKFMKIGETDG